MATVGRAAAQGAAMLTVAQLCLTASSYVIAVVLARWLGPAEYGVYGIVYSVLLTVELLARLGIPQAVSKLIAEQPQGLSGLEATGVTLTLIVSVTVFVAFWFAAPALAAAFHVRDGAHLFRIAALDIPLYSMYIIADHILNGRRWFGVESAGIILYGLFKLAGILLLNALGLSIVGVLIVNALASAFTFGFLLNRLGTSILMLTLRHWNPILRLAMPVGVSLGGMQLLLSIDLWLLNAVGTGVPEADKGMYVAALNLARMPKSSVFRHVRGADAVDRSCPGHRRSGVGAEVGACGDSLSDRAAGAGLRTRGSPRPRADGSVVLGCLRRRRSPTDAADLCSGPELHDAQHAVRHSDRLQPAARGRRDHTRRAAGGSFGECRADRPLGRRWRGRGGTIGTVDGGSARGMVRPTGAWHVAAVISAAFESAWPALRSCCSAC